MLLLTSWTPVSRSWYFSRHGSHVLALSPKQVKSRPTTTLRPFQYFLCFQISTSAFSEGRLSTTFFGLSTYSKEHNTTTVLLAMRDDILRAMQREVTMAVLADYSKAFDAVAYETVLRKLHGLGFSKVYLRWTVSYLTGRKQFVQMDGKTSRQIEVTFGVLQGSILGPVLFNLYVNAFQPAWVLLSHINTLMTLQPISMRNPLSLVCDPPFM